MYCIATWKEISIGQFEADLPANSGYMLLASPGSDAEFSLFECEFDDSSMSSKVECISEDLFEIIESAKHYPPALAIAREEIEREFEKFPDKLSKGVFLERYKTILVDLIKNQPNQKYIISEAVQTESGYLYKGGYYWIVDYSPYEEQITWVSRDYQLYKNHISYFKIAPITLVQRFGKG